MLSKQRRIYLTIRTLVQVASTRRVEILRMHAMLSSPQSDVRLFVQGIGNMSKEFIRNGGGEGIQKSEPTVDAGPGK